MDIGLVRGTNVIDSNLHFNGFVRIEHVRLETNYFAVGVPHRWNVRHVATTTLKWKSCKKGIDQLLRVDIKYVMHTKKQLIK